MSHGTCGLTETDSNTGQTVPTSNNYDKNYKNKSKMNTQSDKTTSFPVTVTGYNSQSKQYSTTTIQSNNSGFNPLPMHKKDTTPNLQRIPP